MRRIAAVVCLGLAACAAGSRFEEAVATYEARAERCRATFPFDPLPDTERRMAPGEPAYRDCVRDAAEGVLVPALPLDMRAGYGELLAEDRRLGKEVAAGRLSRGEQRAAIDAATARLAEQWRREAEAARRTRAEAEQIDALQRQLTIIDDLVRRGRR